MRIGIEINGVLRDTIGKFKQLYEKHLIEKSELLNDTNEKTYELTFSADTEDVLDMVESVSSSPFEYKFLSEVNSLDLMNHFSFQSKEELYSFMYEEYTMELFGHAPSTETLTFNYLNDFYLNFREENDIIIFSDEIGKSKPSSLFFLSKFGCLIEKIFFYSNQTKNTIWGNIDILLTSNPDLLLNYPSEKILVKFETSYNKNIKSDYTIQSLSEFDSLINKLK
jgi:hypothetical protein